MHGYNFTERVRKVLAMAREESNALHHEYVGTEHILLALIREGEGVASTVLTNLGADAEQMRDRMLDMVKSGKSGVNRADLPYTSRAKKVLELAMHQARELNHSYVGTEHLLLGLIAESKGIGAQVLFEAGVTLEVARVEVVRILGTEAGGESAPARPRQPKRRASLVGVSLVERARRVMARAYDLAAERGAVSVTGAHVAIAILEHREGAANAVLDRLGVDTDALLDALRQFAPRLGPAVTPETVLALDPTLADTVGTIEPNERTADGPVAGTGHLLLGVLTTSPEVAQVFQAHGVTPEQFRDELIRISG